MPEHSALRRIPSVEKILSSAAFAPLVDELGRERVKDAVVVHLDRLRRARAEYDENEAVAAVRAVAASTTSSTLQRVINGTGVIIHTNLGRSPIDAALWQRASDVVTGYANLEFDLESGERGARDEHLSALCQTLFGCEAAILTNNNAGGTLLLLAAVAAKREVLVSRGELVEIGGAFRVPDVIQQGGAKLREVGTTNRTRARDYADAVTKKCAAILRVHRSNFEIVGFTETPSVEELLAVAHAKRLPLLYDEGSGRVVDLAPYGFARAETIRELFAKGVDAVTCSTDKLIGATQGGLILGSAEIVGRCRKHPLLRALRAGKESYAVVGETLRAFATGKHEEQIPIYRMLSTPLDALRARAAELTRGTSATVIDSACALGGGTTPAETIPSIAILVPGNANALYDAFLGQRIAGRIVDDRFTVEMRTLLEEDLPRVTAALRAAAPA
ncbi:MAG TPA: L-seryl-tRNA(Sec) selenium transferase [Thermoanaerobaculia bacterium]|nr:L-seryl-tRNA(Sec) selenium transferase [Thermoanaerobaculia bacterium]